MRMLLDSHSFIWFVLDQPQLSDIARKAVIDPANDILISPATYWEIAIKVGKKKLDLQVSYDDFMERGIIGNRFEIPPIDVRHTALLDTMLFHHNDPLDRLLIAQAKVERIPIASNDEIFDAYGITRIW